MRSFLGWTAVLSTVAFSGSRTDAESLLSLAPPHIPNFVGLGFGAIPDYIGSDDYFTGFAPAGNLDFGDGRLLSLVGNHLSYNASRDANWLYGPSLLYRFGRDGDIDDPVVARLSEIDDTVEVGAFLRYEVVGPADPRDRWSLGGDVGFDVGGEHDGYVATASLRRWLPVGRFGALGLAAAMTYGSGNYTDTYFSVTPEDAALTGLPQYGAGGGLRDARLMAVFVQPVSRNWLLGAGVGYSRLLGDVADSPIVDQRGDRDQLIYGVGVGYTW